MTKILFYFDTHTLIMLAKDEATQEIVSALKQGDWHLFNPIDKLIPPDLAAADVQISALDAWLLVRLPQNEQAANLAAELPVELSPRQLEVLDHLSQGLTNKEIAYKLKLSLRTVNLHIAAIKRKFGAQTTAQSVGRAAALGYCRQNMRRNKGQGL